MGIITKTVKVKLASKNIEHYKDKGYGIPIRPLLGAANKCRKKRDWGYDLGAELDVNVEDLPSKSNIDIDVFCDCCGKTNNMHFADYNKRINPDTGKYLCIDCKRANKDIDDAGRFTSGYTKMVRTVLKRDNYICQCCGKVATDVHHLNGYNWFIEGREDPNNCISLCYGCHTEFHKANGYGDNTKEQYIKWVEENLDKMKTLPAKYRGHRPIYCFDDGEIYIDRNELAIKYNITNKAWDYLCDKDKHSSFKDAVLLWYDQYLEMTDYEREFYRKNKFRETGCQRFICLDTLEIFESGLEAAKKYHTTSSTITQSLDRESYAGHDENGKPMHWMRYEDYINASPEYIKERLAYLPSYYKPVILLNTGEMFDRYTTAEKATGIGQYTISKYCRGITKSGGKLSDGTKANWMLLSDYQNLSPIEKNKIYEIYSESFVKDSFLYSNN